MKVNPYSCITEVINKYNLNITSMNERTLKEAGAASSGGVTETAVEVEISKDAKALYNAFVGIE